MVDLTLVLINWFQWAKHRGWEVASPCCKYQGVMGSIPGLPYPACDLPMLLDLSGAITPLHASDIKLNYWKGQSNDS